MKKIFDYKGNEIDVIHVDSSKNYIFLPPSSMGLVESDNPNLKVIFAETDFIDWIVKSFKVKNYPPYPNYITWLKVKQWNALVRKAAEKKHFQLPLVQKSLVQKFLPIEEEVFKAFVYPVNSNSFSDKRLFQEWLADTSKWMYTGDYIRVKNKIYFNHEMFQTIIGLYFRKAHLDKLSQWRLPANVIAHIAFHVWDTFVFGIKFSEFIGGLSEKDFLLTHKYLCGEMTKTQLKLIQDSLTKGG